MLNRLSREPLFHFLLVGALLFIFFELIAQNKNQYDDKRIVVDRNQLLSYFQYRFKIYDVNKSSAQFDKLSSNQRQTLIDDYVTEEALFREAKAFNLDKNDYSARQRLIQQLTYINEGFISSSISTSQDELKQYLEDHHERYLVAAKITFTHVFFRFDANSNKNTRTDKEVQKLAHEKLIELNQSQVPFHKSLSHGERFLYHRNYVNKEADEISSHFGATMQQQLFSLKTDHIRWYGPYQSLYGFHLVMVTKKSDEYFPALSEVMQRVEQDALQDKLKTELDKINQAIVDEYDISITKGLFGSINK